MKKVVVLLLLLFPVMMMGYTELTGDLSDQTITAGTYLVNQCTVADGATLEIQAGAILKFNSGCRLTVNGTLSAIGTSSKQIIFTSFKDDSFGGDTNGGWNSNNTFSK